MSDSMIHIGYIPHYALCVTAQVLTSGDRHGRPSLRWVSDGRRTHWKWSSYDHHRRLRWKFGIR